MAQEEEEEEEVLTPSRRALYRSASWSVRSAPPPPSNLRPRPNSRPNRPCLPPLKPLRPPLRPSDLLTPSATAAVNECSRIADHIYIGSEIVARDRDALRRHGITHVLNCVGSSCPNYFREDLTYMTLYLHDSPSEDITSVLYDAFDFFELVRCSSPSARLLVHCSKGASRSAALVIAYLMWSSSISFHRALSVVRSCRSLADPNLGFASQLLLCQARIHAVPPTPKSACLLRVYRIAPHSAFDPLHLVPKPLDPSLPRLLDSRGAFLLVRFDSGIFIWLGRSCHPAMARRGASAAGQIVKYEKARGPIVTVGEGSESDEFWGLFAAAAGERQAEPGERRVDLYDLDFDIFKRAIKCETLEEEEEEEEERDEFRSPESFSGESSSTSTDSPSTLSTFSPASCSSSSPSSSDLYTAPQTPFVLDKLPPLRSRRGKRNEDSMSQSLAGRRGNKHPSLVLLPPLESGECRLSPRDIVRDWCLSPPFVSDVENEQPTSSGRIAEEEEEEEEGEGEESCRMFDANDYMCYERPILFRWPDMKEVEEVNPAALDSESVFILLAPDSSLGKRNSKSNILYVWVGRHYQMVNPCESQASQEHEGNRGKVDFDSIRGDFVDQMALPLDTPVQIIREEEEPEQFLNHLFSFHREKEPCTTE